MRCLVLALLLIAAPVVADSSAPPASAPSAPAVAPSVTPYADSEFEPWMLKLRRAEILTIGTFPLAYLLGGLGYDYVYYFTNGRPQENIPWPIGPGTSRWVSPAQADLLAKKNLTLVGASLAAGLVLAAVDWWLGE